MIGYHLGAGWRGKEVEGWRGKENASLTQIAKQKKIKTMAWDALTCKSSKGYDLLTVNSVSQMVERGSTITYSEGLMRQNRDDHNKTLITECWSSWHLGGGGVQNASTLLYFLYHKNFWRERKTRAQEAEATDPEEERSSRSFWQFHLHLAFLRLASITPASSQMLWHINSLEISSHFTWTFGVKIRDWTFSS